MKARHASYFRPADFSTCEVVDTRMTRAFKEASMEASKLLGVFDAGIGDGSVNAFLDHSTLEWGQADSPHSLGQ